MTFSSPQFKPSPEPAVGWFPAAAVTVSALVSYLVFPQLLLGLVVVALAVVIYRALVIETEPAPKRGRALAVSEGVLRQFDLGDVVARIDVTQPFEYRVLDRYGVADALFRLYQRNDELSFYVSDPGGGEVVEEVVQISWPPRNRHAGRSYPPPASRERVAASKRRRCGIDPTRALVTCLGRRIRPALSVAGGDRSIGGWTTRVQ